MTLCPKTYTFRKLLFVVSGSEPFNSRSWSPNRRMTPQPPGPGLPRHPPSVNASTDFIWSVRYAGESLPLPLVAIRELGQASVWLFVGGGPLYPPQPVCAHGERMRPPLAPDDQPANHQSAPSSERVAHAQRGVQSACVSA